MSLVDQIWPPCRRSNIYSILYLHTRNHVIYILDSKKLIFKFKEWDVVHFLLQQKPSLLRHVIGSSLTSPIKVIAHYFNMPPTCSLVSLLLLTLLAFNCLTCAEPLWLTWGFDQTTLLFIPFHLPSTHITLKFVSRMSSMIGFGITMHSILSNVSFTFRLPCWMLWFFVHSLEIVSSNTLNNH